MSTGLVLLFLFIGLIVGMIILSICFDEDEVEKEYKCAAFRITYGTYPSQDDSKLLKRLEAVFQSESPGLDYRIRLLSEVLTLTEKQKDDLKAWMVNYNNKHRKYWEC